MPFSFCLTFLIRPSIFNSYGRAYSTGALLLFCLLPMALAPSTALAAPAAPRLVEQQSEVLALWAKAGISDATVLHVGARFALLPSPDEVYLNGARRLLDARNFSGLAASGSYPPRPGNSFFSSSNYLSMAAKLGLVDKVYFAIPLPASFVSHDELAAFRDFLVASSPARYSEQLQKLSIEPPFLSGEIDSVAVQVGPLGAFVPDGPTVLDVNLDFFAAMHKNPVSTSYLGLLYGFADKLRELDHDFVFSSICFSNADSRLPLDLRYLGSRLQAMLANPAMLSSAPPQPWLLFSNAAELVYFFQLDDAARIYSQVIELNPSTPEAYYALAVVKTRQKAEIGEIRGLIKKAAALDDAYLAGVPDVAAYIAGEGYVELATETLEWALSLSPNLPRLNTVLGNIHLEAGDLPKAIDCYRSAIAGGDDSPASNLKLAAALAAHGETAKALAAGQRALELSTAHDPAPPDTWSLLKDLVLRTGPDAEALRALSDSFLSVHAERYPAAVKARIVELLRPSPPD